MATRFQTDIHSSSRRRLAAIIQGIDLSVRAAETSVIALADYLPVANEYSSDYGIRLDSSPATLGQL